MNFLTISLLLIISSAIIPISSRFGDPGRYPFHQHLDINLLQCGYIDIPNINDIKQGECFDRKVGNRVFVSFDRYCDQSKTFDRIFRGRGVGYAETPFTVHVASSRGICTGVLVTFQWVLTAAHCVDPSASDFQCITVTIASNKLVVIETRHSFKAFFYPHPWHYDSYQTNLTRETHDIALIRLMEPFTRHKHDGCRYLINTICLPESGVVNGRDEMAYFYGWGHRDRSGEFPMALQYGFAQVTYNNCPFEKRGFLCALYPQPNTEYRICPGDSGGPLVKKHGNEWLGGKYGERSVLVGTAQGAQFLDNNDKNCSENINRAYWVPVPNVVDWIIATIMMLNGVPMQRSAWDNSKCPPYKP